MRAASAAVVVVQLAIVAWMGRDMFRSYGRGHADFSGLAPLAGILVLLTTVNQIIELARDPSRTVNWTALGVGLIGSTLAVLIFVRRRLRSAP